MQWLKSIREFDRSVGRNHQLQFFIYTSSIVGTTALLFGHVAFGRFGWDFNTYKVAVEIWLTGGNPYSIETMAEFGHPYLFIYPPITLPILSAFTLPAIWSEIVYFFEYGVFLLAGSYLVVRADRLNATRSDYIWAIALILSGFGGGYWTLYSGNSDILMLFLICLSLYLANSNRWFFSGFLFGLAGSIKILPFLAGGVYLILKIKLTDKIRGILGLISAPIVIYGGSYLLFSDLFPQKFFDAVSTEGGVTQLAGEGSVTSSPLLYFWQDLARVVGLSGDLGF
jgi:hypothetical protein